MKLSQLQRLRLDLSCLDLTKSESALKDLGLKIDPIDPVNYEKKPLVDAYYRTRSGLEATRNEIRNLIRDIDRDIQSMYEWYLEDSEREDAIHAKAGVEANRTTRTMRILPDTERVIKDRMGTYVNWHWAGLEIGPGDGYWTKHMVAMDPLYIADVHPEFLESTRKSFSPEYQLRIRPYLIKDADLSQLPQKQFGFVFAWNVFNYMSLGHIRRYLEAIQPLLKPGAVLMFSYNNCDRWHSTSLAETGFATFVPNSRLVPMVHELGFEVLRSFDMETNISWIEIKKPGTLTSNRTGQTLGKIRQNLT